MLADDNQSRSRIDRNGCDPPCCRPPAPPPAASTAHLDGLRGVAALLVLFTHYVSPFGLDDQGHGFGEGGAHHGLFSLPFIRLIVSGGSAAVTVFFVLSGYVLSLSPLRELAAATGGETVCIRSLVSAAVRRPVRLYLPCLGVTFIIAVLMHAPFPLMGQRWPEPDSSLAAEMVHWLVDTVSFLNPFRMHSNMTWAHYLLVLWTVPVELIGSYLVYGLIATWALVPLSRSHPVLGAALLAVSVPVFLYLGFWMPACFVGGLVLSILDIVPPVRNVLPARHAATSFLWAACLVASLYLLSQPSSNGYPDHSAATPGWRTLHRLIPAPPAYGESSYYRFWHSYGSILLVASCLHLHAIQRFFLTRPLRYLGRVSFMVYLVHLPVLSAWGDRVKRMVGTETENDTFIDNLLPVPDWGPLRFAVAVGFVLPVVIYLAELGTTYLDQPSVRLGKALAVRLGLEKGEREAGEGAEVLPMQEMEPIRA